MQYGVFGDGWSNAVQMDYRFILAQESPRIVAAKKLSSIWHT
jgi:hypothetical protein